MHLDHLTSIHVGYCSPSIMLEVEHKKSPAYLIYTIPFILKAGLTAKAVLDLGSHEVTFNNLKTFS